jgi:LysM repeat protein
MGSMAEARRFSIWTILAPLGLIAVFVVALMLVRGALETPPPEAAEPTITATAPTATVNASVPAFYRIRKGDTLSAIAERYGVTTDYIVQLNPNLNPMALAVHAKIRLR